MLHIRQNHRLKFAGIVFLLVLASSALVSRLPVALGAEGDTIPPHVFDTDPLPGEELALEGRV